MSPRAGPIRCAGLALCCAALAACGVKAPPRPPGGTEVPPAVRAPAPEEDTVSGEAMDPAGSPPPADCPGCAATPPER